MSEENLRIQRQSSLNNISSIVVLGLKSSIFTPSNRFIDLHVDQKSDPTDKNN